MITDHALIRWCERRLGIKMDALRAELEMLAKPYVDAGVVTACVEGVWIVIENGRVVTILSKKPSHDGHSAADQKRGNRRNSEGYDPMGPLPWQGKKRRRRN